MAKDDFEVVAYKILAYFYACLKAGAEPSVEKAREVAKVNPTYFYAVLSSLSSKGLIEPVREFRDVRGEVVLTDGTLTITLDGAEYLKENATMRKVARFLGSAFAKAVEVAVEATLAL